MNTGISTNTMTISTSDWLTLLASITDATNNKKEVECLSSHNKVKSKFELQLTCDKFSVALTLAQHTRIHKTKLVIQLSTVDTHTVFSLSEKFYIHTYTRSPDRVLPGTYAKKFFSPSPLESKKMCKSQHETGTRSKSIIQYPASKMQHSTFNFQYHQQQLEQHWSQVKRERRETGERGRRRGNRITWKNRSNRYWMRFFQVSIYSRATETIFLTFPFSPSFAES